jgi:hypothetical protein
VPSPPSLSNTPNNTISAAPATPASATAAPINSSSPYDSTTPKTMLKVPSQRGPGSTLRIRSMLAKRNHQQPSPRQDISGDD